MNGVRVCVLSLCFSLMVGMSEALADAPVVSIIPKGGSGYPTAPLTLEQRLQLLENKVQYYERSDLVLEIQNLREQLQNLQGQLEEHAHSLQQLTKQQTEFYSDFDRRLTAINKSSTATSNPEIATSSAPVKSNVTSKQNNHSATTAAQVKQAAPTMLTASANPYGATAPTTEPVVEPVAKLPSTEKSTVSYLPATPSAQATALASVPLGSVNTKPSVKYTENMAQKSYDAAFRLIGQRKYFEAQLAMADFVTHYPQSRYAANAHYWLGELYLKNGDRAQALTHFQTIKTTFAAHPKSADARYKLAMMKKADGDVASAKEEFNTVVSHYPGTAAAQLASVQLRQLA